MNLSFLTSKLAKNILIYILFDFENFVKDSDFS